MVEKLLTANDPAAGEISGRELAGYIVLSELLTELVKREHLTQDQVRDILWRSGMRLYCIRCDLNEKGSTVDGEKLEDEGHHLLNVIDDDISSTLARFFRKRRRA
jgi:hypothetical protein